MAHTLASRRDGTTWAWGDNQWGQLGDGTTTDRATPVQVAFLRGATRVAAGFRHSLALKSDGTLWAWGRNAEGQLRIGRADLTGCLCQPTPVPVLSLSRVTAIVAGFTHSLAVQDGALWAWGDNTFGQLGDGTTEPRLAPVQALLPPRGRIAAIAAGHGHSLALAASLAPR